MTMQVNRRYRLLIGDYQNGNGLEITNLQITFDVSKSSDNSNNSNSASIEVYNLSKESLKILDTDYPAAYLYVGYGLDPTKPLKLLFGGQVVNITTRKQGTDRITQLLLGTGYTELNHQLMSKVVPPGKTVKQVCEEVIKQFPNIQRGVFNGTNLNNTVSKGYSLSGTVKEVLDKISDTYKLEWRIDDDVLYINDKDRAETENFDTAYVITPETGLIEIPYYTSGDSRRTPKDKAKKNGVQFSMLINPEIIAGKIVKLEDTDITGWFKVDSIRYSGSWRAGNWTQDVYCSALEKVNNNNN